MGRGLLVIVASLVIVAPARAASGEGPLQVSGGVTVSWHGRAGSCEAVGLCGVRGVVGWRPDRRGEVVYFGGPGHWQPNFLSMFSTNAPVARVLRTAPDGATSACVDLVGSDSGFNSWLQLVPGPRGMQLTLGSPEGFLPFSAGRCAGPVPEDLSAALPSAPYRTAGTMDLRAAKPFASGPFAGVVRSTLRATAGPVRRESSTSVGTSSPPAPGSPRVAVVRLVYRVVSVSGGFRADVAGDAAPGCEAAGSCGASGTIEFAAADVVGRRLRLSAYRLLRGDGPYGTARGLADLRAGRLSAVDGYFDGDFIHATSTTMQLAGERAPCADEVTGRLPGIDVGGTRRIRFAIDTRFSWGSRDVLRTRCPGPGYADVAGNAPLLAGAVPVARLAEATPAVTLTASGRFAAGGWAGERSGTVTLGLRRTRVHVGTRG